MKNIELVNTGRLTERQARLNMERCAEFLARMIQKCYIYTRVSTAAQTDGYSLDAQTDRLRKYADYKELEVVPEEEDLVRLIYQKYLEADMKLNTVVLWLNENGHKRTVKGKDKPVTSDFVLTVLENPVYYGMIVYNRRTNSEEIRRNPKQVVSIRGRHEAIISEDDWIRVQEKRERLSHPKRKVDDPDRISLLSGLVTGIHWMTVRRN